MFVRFRVAILLAFLALGLSPVLASAQATTTVRVVTTDQSGAVVPAVTLTLVHRETLVERQAVSAADGTAEFLALTPGRYTLTAELAGFTTSEIRDVDLVAGTPVTLRLVMQVESVTAGLVVTASAAKFSVPLEETPQAIGLIPREQLDVQRVQSVQEAFRYVPSVQGEISGRTGYDEFQIRGFTQSRYQFRDGLRLDPGYLQQQEPFGLERLEVLRGPASVLYGQISPGGLVNMVSKLPVAQNRRELTVTGGNFGQANLAIDINSAINRSGTWRVRLPLLVSRRDDMLESVGADRLFVAPSLAWVPSARTSVVFTSLLQRDRYDRTIGLPVEGTIVSGSLGRLDRRTFLGEPGLDQIESPQRQLGVLLSHQVSAAWTVRQNLRWMSYEVRGPITQAPRPGSTEAVVRRRGFDYRGDTNILSSDSQVEGVLSGRGIEHRILAGVDWQRYRDENSGELFLLPSINPFAPVYGAAATQAGPFFAGTAALDQVGVYGQYRAKVRDRLAATVGVRRSDSSTRTEDRLGGTTNSQDDQATTLSAGLMYLGQRGWSPYVTVAQSFEPQVGNDPLADGSRPSPSRGQQTEVGLKWTSPARRVEASAALFDLSQTDVVNGDPDNPGFSLLIGEQVHRGLDADVALRPSASVALTASYAWLDAEITSSKNGDEGLTPINVPTHAGSVQLTLAGDLVSLPAADGFIGLRAMGARRAGAPGTELPGYAAVDTGIRYRLGRYVVGLNAKNLFDARYFAGVVGLGIVPGESRTWLISLKAAF